MTNIFQFKPRDSGKPENYRGVRIASRRNSAADILDVRKLVDKLHENGFLNGVIKIDLDGNACATWTCVSADKARLDLVANSISFALVDLFSGYNWLSVTSLDGDRSEHLGPYWNEDYKDFEPGMPA